MTDWFIDFCHNNSTAVSVPPLSTWCVMVLRPNQWHTHPGSYVVVLEDGCVVTFRDETESRSFNSHPHKKQQNRKTIQKHGLTPNSFDNFLVPASAPHLSLFDFSLHFISLFSFCSPFHFTSPHIPLLSLPTFTTWFTPPTSHSPVSHQCNHPQHKTSPPHSLSATLFVELCWHDVPVFTCCFPCLLLDSVCLHVGTVCYEVH